ncbi:MAG TPA: glycosyltransferase family 1 protein [Burkholderiaceae bacterium]|nr:glycosyltransferase family 1 protein [Burkholderiaceae bacterium]
MDASTLIDSESLTTARAARLPMRIAIVSETYPPEVNGVALTLQRMLEGLRARRHVVQLVRLRQYADDLPQRARGYHEVLVRGVPIPRYPHLRMGLPCTRTLERLWSMQRPDVVHIATEGPLGWSALRAAQRLGVPVVSDFRTNFHAYSRHYGLGWLQRGIVGYLRGFHNRTLTTMVPTPVLQRELAAQGFENLRVVARGVDTAHLNPAKRNAALRRLWGAGDDTVVVLCVSRLAGEKNLLLLWRAFEAIERRGLRARLVLVGDGPQREALQSLCRGAHFAGVRRGEDLAAHYASADLFVFPSLTETFGNVVPEAMASGLPVVAFDHAAAGQLIRHGESGWLAAAGEPVQLVDLAAHAAGDRAALRAMGARARETALALDWQRVVDDLEGVLRRAATQTDAAQSPLLLRPLST